MRSRINALLLCALCAALLVALVAALGSARTWALWHIPALLPDFADLRAVTSGAESVRLGLDPLLHNPADPWGRPLNYPRIWQGLAALGVDQGHTRPIAAALILLFLAGVCLILPGAGAGTLALVAAALLSPAVLLGIERANIDLLMFFLLAVTVAALRSRRAAVLAPVALLLASVLKLYPIIAVAVLLRIDRARALRLGLALLACFAVYLWLTRADLRLISQATPRATELSYGLSVAWMRLAPLFPSIGSGLRYVAMVALLSGSIAAAWLALRQAGPRVGHGALPADTLAGDAFVVGAAVYLGSFLIGNNFDYRLMFLIFTLPQLALWVRHAQHTQAWVTALTLAAILGSLWHLVAAAALAALGVPALAVFLLDEGLNWALFFGLVHGLAVLAMSVQHVDRAGSPVRSPGSA